MRSITKSLLIALLLLIGGPGAGMLGLHSPFVAVAHAEDDDSDAGNAPGGAAPSGSVLDAAMQWRLADTAWQKREYDDAAVLSIGYADANPDEPYVLEALWRAYNVYRNNRPNADKKKLMVDKLSAACSKWLTKYATSDKERAGSALAYEAYLYDAEGQRDAAISTWDQLTKRFPGTQHEQEAWWDVGEWEHSAGHWSNAITHYEGYRKCVGITEYGALSCFREADCYEQLKDKATAIATYKIVFDDKYNWGWYQLGYGALDASRRLLVDGDGEASRKMALMIIDKSPKDWTDIQAQAHALIGDTPAKKVFLFPFLYNTYDTSHINIDGSSKITVTHEPRLLVRVTYATKADPFDGILTVTPKVPMATVPDGLKKGDGDKPSYTVEIKAPDKDGNGIGDLWYNFKQEDESVSPPADLVLTRKWDKAGADWGTCTVRIQSSGRWHMWIYLPNDKTNANNLNVQPNEVNDGGKTFRWYDWYDLTQGMTIKFPITVGTDVTEYYPKIRLERNIGRTNDKSDTSTDAKETTMPEYDIDLKADKAYPFTFNHPENEVLYMDEISK